MIYKLIAELTTDYNGEIEVNKYEQIFFVRLLGDNRQNAVIYDKELRMYFENPSAICLDYEIEIRKVTLYLCRRLRKSEDFNTKLFYRYDWLQPKVNAKGKVVSIENKNEIKNTWQKLRNRITVDYKGDYVDKYMEKIDLEFGIDETVYPVLTQYLHFGLLFPNIPKEHSRDWVGKRLVTFSPYEKEKFVETTTLTSTEENRLMYEISGSALSESNTQVKNYSGYVKRAKNDILPLETEINTDIEKDGIISQWSFKLYKL